MTVKLLSSWGAQPSGTLYTTDAATETAMVTSKVATATLTGGVPWLPSLGTPNVGDGGVVSKYPLAQFWKGPMPKLAAARSRGPAAPPRIAFTGDSNLCGDSAAGASSSIGARSLCFPFLIARALGWQTGTIFGDQNMASASTATTPNQYDPRVVLGSGVTVGAAGVTFGGRAFELAVASGFLSFTPTVADGLFDKVRFCFARTATVSSASVDILIDGVVVGNVSQVGANDTMYSPTYTVTKGSHLIQLRNNDGAQIARITGIETWDSTNGAPILLQGGWCGGKLSDLSNAALGYNCLPTLATMQPDAVLLHCTINDMINATAIATVSAGIDAINLAMGGTADVINTVSFAVNLAKTLDGTLDSYASLLRANAASYGGAFADARAATGSSYGVASSRGFTSNIYHPSAAGQVAIAGMFQQLFQ
ncbi:MAG: hypothetical protein JWP29_1091 [Rhodoferax sp.]|nr:hypothetical protein [Rhodoferax sp.]